MSDLKDIAVTVAYAHREWDQYAHVIKYEVAAAREAAAEQRVKELELALGEGTTRWARELNERVYRIAELERERDEKDRQLTSCYDRMCKAEDALKAQAVEQCSHQWLGSGMHPDHYRCIVCGAVKPRVTEAQAVSSEPVAFLDGPHGKLRISPLWRLDPKPPQSVSWSIPLYTAPPNHRAVMEQALEALKYHVEQTRPIQKTSEAIAALKEALK